MTDRSNDSVYPFRREFDFGDGTKEITQQDGMTIREKIAADNLAALYGAMTLLPIDRQKGVCRIWQEKYGETTLGQAMAMDSIELADFLIAELSKSQEK